MFSVLMQQKAHNHLIICVFAAPPAFKLKKSERKKIKASSPFSSNRDYNLDLNKKFELKKGDKKVTQFKEFQHKGGDWKVRKIAIHLNFPSWSPL